MTVGGIFAKADIGDDVERRKAVSEEADGLNDGTLRVVGCGAKSVFGIGFEGDAKEDDRSEAFGDEGLDVGNQFVEAAAVL